MVNSLHNNIAPKSFDLDSSEDLFDERELNFQFVLLEKNVTHLSSSLALEKAAKTELQILNSELKKQNKAQAELLKSQKQQVKEWEARVKQLEKNQESLQQKIQSLKEYSIIVKNPKNADAIEGLKGKLDDYIRYIEESISLLRTI